MPDGDVIMTDWPAGLYIGHDHHVVAVCKEHKIPAKLWYTTAAPALWKYAVILQLHFILQMGFY